MDTSLGPVAALERLIMQSKFLIFELETCQYFTWTPRERSFNEFLKESPSETEQFDIQASLHNNWKQETPLKKRFCCTIKAAYSGSKPLLSSTRAITNPVFYISDLLLQFKPWALAVLAFDKTHQRKWGSPEIRNKNMKLEQFSPK